MRTTIELSERTYVRLRAAAAERGLRGFSPIVEEALRRLLDDPGSRNWVSPEIAEAEGAWSQEDAEEWEEARAEAWATWRSDRSWTPTS